MFCHTLPVSYSERGGMAGRDLTGGVAADRMTPDLVLVIARLGSVLLHAYMIYKRSYFGEA